MKLFCVFWLWIFLPEFRIAFTSDINIHGYSGKSVIITCSHTWAAENNKYFCQNPCEHVNDILVSSYQSRNGKHTLKDFGNGSFTVTITDLQESDSGIYWCGVERLVKDTYHEVNLTVSKDPSESITTSTQPHKSIRTSTDLRTTTPAALSTTASRTDRYSSPDALILSPSVTVSIRTLQYAAGGLVIAGIIFLFGLVTVYQYRKRVKTSEGCGSAKLAKRNKSRDEEDAQNRTEIKSRDKTDVMKCQTDSVYQSLNIHVGQLNEVYVNL